MTLWGAFSNGVAGLYAASEAFGAVTQNMANTRTPGYRRVETEFVTLLGGITANGREPGGVRPVTRTSMDVQGPLEITNRTFDIAIDGPGLFVFGPFSGGGNAVDLRYSRAGNLISIRAPNNETVGYLGNETGLYLLGWRLVNGQVVNNSLAALEPIPGTTDDEFPGQATREAELIVTLPATGTSASTEIFYFDQNGDQHTLWLKWTKTGPNAWSLQATDVNGAAVGGPILMTFDGEGRLASAPTVNIAGLFDLDVSKVNQLGSVFVLGEYVQDGIARGEFITYEILPDGTVNGRYTSGAVRPLYRIPVATFMNPNALVAESGTMYRATAAAGEPRLHKAGDDRIQIVPGAIEMANFDLSDSFTRLIVTQRAYDTASQVVRTVDEMAQVARDMKS
ncbi:MAG TPA: flagellar hook-basal body complex protein [Alphaproteobacteria bacterium]